MAMNKNSLNILKWLKNTNPEDTYTTRDIAEALQLKLRSVNGMVSALCRAKDPLLMRIPARMENNNGEWEDVSVIRLTDKGYNFNVDEYLAKLVATLAEKHA